MTEPLIVSDPKVMMGKPVIAGTILEAHPRLTWDAVLAALRYATQALRSEVVYSITRSA